MQSWAAPQGLDALALLLEVVQQLVVMLMEHDARYLVQTRHDVPGPCSVLSALQPGSKLTCMKIASISACSVLSTLKPGSKLTCTNIAPIGARSVLSALQPGSKLTCTKIAPIIASAFDLQTTCASRGALLNGVEGCSISTPAALRGMML